MLAREAARAAPQRRHDLVWLAADWHEALAFPLPEIDGPRVSAWIAGDRPLVAARPVSTDPEGGIRLGLGLPGRRRIGLVAAPGIVRRIAPPLPLEEAASLAPEPWRGPLMDLAVRLTDLGLGPRVFGSLAWHALASEGIDGRETGYLTPSSDVDLLLYPTSADACAAAAQTLEDFAALHRCPRLDGEFVLPDSGAVAWREFLAGPERILVKHLHGQLLRPTKELFVSSVREGT